MTMNDLYFLSDDASGKLAIVRINPHPETEEAFNKALATEAERWGMAHPDGGNLTWGGASSISINI